MNKTKFKSEDICKLILLYEYNISIKDLSYYFNVNRSTIYRALKKAKAKRLSLPDIIKLHYKEENKTC